MEYKYSLKDVISVMDVAKGYIDIESLVGKKAYYYATIKRVLENANSNDKDFFGEIEGIEMDGYGFRIVDNLYCWGYVILEKQTYNKSSQDDYKTIQDEWIAKNNITFNSVVIGQGFGYDGYLGGVESIEDDGINVRFFCDNQLIKCKVEKDIEPYHQYKDIPQFHLGDMVIYTNGSGVKRVGIIKQLSLEKNSAFIAVNGGGGWRSLNDVKKATDDDFVPYDLSKKEVRDKLRGKWIVDKITRKEFPIDIFQYDSEKKEWIIYMFMNALSLLKCYTFLDGTPCGEIKES